MVPAVVHAALVTIFIWSLQLLAGALNIPVSENTINEVATLIVGYILSLAGLALFNRARNKGLLVTTEDYHPPFT